jgi:RNA polymerase sigma-70 factor, ECF subfamily
VTDTALAQFREALVALLPRLRRLARTLTRSLADADDLVQLAVERALQCWHQWRPEQRLDAWVFAILRHAWFDELRARRRHGEVLTDDPEAAAAAPDGGAGALEQLALQRALAVLPEEQCSAVLLVLVEGLSYAEAAEAMGVPVGTLTSRLARGRATLADILEGVPGDATR